MLYEATKVLKNDLSLQERSLDFHLVKVIDYHVHITLYMNFDTSLK